jgi:bacterioferritin
MKGNAKVIEFLNRAVLAEIGGIDQYVIHSAMYDNAGFAELSKAAMNTAKEEMGHLDRYIDRILFLGGAVTAGKMDSVSIGQTPFDQIQFDKDGEYKAVNLYNEAILACVAAEDAGTRELFESILKDEERHANYWETQQALIKSIGLQNYLVEQIG